MTKKLFPKMMKSFFPPCVSNIQGKTWTVFDGTWHRIPKGTTVKEVRKYWIPTNADGTPEDIYRDISDANGIWEVPSSKGDKEYTVKLTNGTYTCRCIGYGFRRNCSHIKDVRAGKHDRVS